MRLPFANTYIVLCLLCSHLAGDVLPTPRRELCDALAQVQTGERLAVVITGIYEVSYENAVFYDPDHPLCALDVQPVTAVEFPSSFVPEASFNRLLAADHRAYVTFEGILEGPKKLTSPDLSLPPTLDLLNRNGGRRYGHMYAYRTRFIVSGVLQWSEVPATKPRYGQWRVPRVASSIPLLTAAALPHYPEAARKAGLMGTVVEEVHVHDGTITAVTALFGERLLVAAAEENIKTWQFASSTSATFTTIFRFELERRQTGADENPRIELHLPEYVKIIAHDNAW